MLIQCSVERVDINLLIVAVLLPVGIYHKQAGNCGQIKAKRDKFEHIYVLLFIKFSLSSTGVKISDAYNAVLEYVKKEKADLVAKLTKNLG